MNDDSEMMELTSAASKSVPLSSTSSSPFNVDALLLDPALTALDNTMARPGERGDQPDLAPNQQYPPAGQAQFPPTEYPYHQTSQYPSLDQDMNMTDSYGQAIHQNITGQLREAVAGAPRNGDAVNSNGAASAGMAPPVTPQHANVEETPDTADMGNSKRKRSKSSKACDQCRRKKVKCDGGDLDGPIRTCSNCQKAGNTCEFSRIPMKRGPSKGYIKELSDRVQQVESLQAIIAGQPGYRQSLDGGSMTEPLYSPDDPMSLKRNFSFSNNNGPNPFAASEFQRDRIPSVGGAWTSSPTSAGFRPRNRGSMALAPDQSLPQGPTSYPKTSIPYWSTTASEPRPAKRQKLDSDKSKLKMESKHLNKYYEVVHPELSLLPDLDTTLNIVNSATSRFQSFFAVSVELIPGTGTDAENTPDAVKSAVSDAFPNLTSVWSFFTTAAAELPDKRSAEDNLLFVWACVLLAAHAEYKMTGIAGGAFGRSSFIKLAMDLTASLQENEGAEEKVPAQTEPELFKGLVQQARNVNIILAKVHALGTASMDFVSPDTFNISIDDIQALPPNSGFQASLSNVMSMVTLEVQNLLVPTSPVNIAMKNLIIFQLQGCIGIVPGITRDMPMCRQATLFIELVLSRYHYIPLAAFVLAPAAQLAEELAQAAEPVSTGPIVYKPLDLHMFTLTTITLLEVLFSVPDAGMLAMAEQALNTIQPVLERKAESYHNYKSSLEKSESWFQKDEEDAGDGKSWMEVLLKHIDERRKVGWIAAPSANGGGVPVGGNVTVAFDMLLRTGYLKVLSNLA